MEAVVKGALGINSFRELSKDRVMGVFDQIGGIELEARKKMTENIPNLGNAIRSVADRTANMNADLADHGAAATSEAASLRSIYQESLREQLRNPDLKPEERSDLNDRMERNATAGSEEVADQRAWLGRIAEHRSALTLGLGVGLVLAYSGFKRRP